MEEGNLITMERRIITTDVLEEDVKIEGSLRPQHLDDYIGQEKTKKNLKVYIEAAKQRSDVLDHVPVSYTHLTLPTICSV